MVKQKIKRKAYSYIRFSTPEQAQGDSQRRQTKIADDFAIKHDLDLDRNLTFSDLGVSGFRGKNAAKGALRRFLDAVESGDVVQGSVLILENLDRVSRQAPWDALPILQLIINGGVSLGFPVRDKIISRDDMRGEGGTWLLMEMVMELARANSESAAKGRRLKAAWVGKRLKASTHALTAHTPGWIKLDGDRKPVLIAERAKIVQRIVRDYMRGVGKHGIASALNKESVPTFRKALHWHRSYIDKVLSSPALMGTFVPHIEEHSGDKMKRLPQEAVANYFPAVIDADTYVRLQEINRKSPLRGRHAHGQMRNVLSGLARCPQCGATMTRVMKGTPKKGGKPQFACTRAKTGAGCEYHSVPYDAVEGVLLKEYEHIIRDMPHPDAQIEKELRNAQAVVDDLQGRVSDLLDLLERRPSDAMAKRVVSLEESLRAAEAARAELLSRAAQSEKKILQMKADTLGVAVRSKPINRERINAALRELFESVTLDYTSGHLVFKWRALGETSVMFMWPEERTAKIA